MSIRTLPQWPEIRPFVRIQIYAPDGGYKNPRFRLEIDRSATPSQRLAWLNLQAPCVRCGRAINPIRERQPGARTTIGALYIAPCCPLSVNVGCSRGNAAHDEYLAIRREVEQFQPAQVQQ